MRGCAPCSSATVTANWFLSSRTRFRPFSMNSSKRAVNLAMRSRSSSKPKLMLGRLSATEGAAIIVCRPCELLGSKTEAMLDNSLMDNV